MKQKVAIALSGGVDSAVAALLLKREGWQVKAIFMQNWEEENCPSREDLVFCASVCDVLGIELEVVNFAKEYKERVFADFLHEYEAGRTPNPDVLCNSEIKFDCLLQHALNNGADYLATGHYAQVREFQGQYQLLKAEDGNKDQTYFLYRIGQKQLRHVMFPVGGLMKEQVRSLAREAGLPNCDRKDSVGICFIGQRPFREFLQNYLPAKPGLIHDLKGRTVGEHLGVMFYTLGQRKGLGIGGGGDSGEPWFVVGKNPQNNILYVAQGREHPMLHQMQVQLQQESWVCATPKTHWVYSAKTRYRQLDDPCEITHMRQEGSTLTFAKPQWATTPGQSAVLYESRVCLGGGIIVSDQMHS